MVQTQLNSRGRLMQLLELFIGGLTSSFCRSLGFIVTSLNQALAYQILAQVLQSITVARARESVVGSGLLTGTALTFF
jgi:hypothetical protein